MWGTYSPRFDILITDHWKKANSKQEMARHSSSSASSRSRSRSRSKMPPRREREERRRRRRSRSGTRSTFSRSPSPGAKRLHIGNLDESIRRCDIEDVYGKYGRITDCWMASYPPFYGFVVFDRADDASKALRDMSTGYIRDCKVRTTVALPRYGGPSRTASDNYRSRPPPPRPRRYYNDRDDNGRSSRLRLSRSRSPRLSRRHRSESPPPKKSAKREVEENGKEEPKKSKPRRKRSRSGSSSASSHSSRSSSRSKWIRSGGAETGDEDGKENMVL